MPTRLIVFVAVVSLLAGCSIPPQEAEFGSISPVETTMAIEQAAELKDLSKVDELVAELDSSDPAIRLVAIAALRDITGQDLGYNPADKESDRLAAITRWEQWVTAERAAGRLPPDQPSTPSRAAEGPPG